MHCRRLSSGCRSTFGTSTLHGTFDAVAPGTLGRCTCHCWYYGFFLGSSLAEFCTDLTPRPTFTPLAIGALFQGLTIFPCPPPPSRRTASSSGLQICADSGHLYLFDSWLNRRRLIPHACCNWWWVLSPGAGITPYISTTACVCGICFRF